MGASFRVDFLFEPAEPPLQKPGNSVGVRLAVFDEVYPNEQMDPLVQQILKQVSVRLRGHGFDLGPRGVQTYRG